MALIHDQSKGHLLVRHNLGLGGVRREEHNVPLSICQFLLQIAVGQVRILAPTPEEQITVAMPLMFRIEQPRYIFLRTRSGGGRRFRRKRTMSTPTATTRPSPFMAHGGHDLQSSRWVYVVVLAPAYCLGMQP